MEDSHQRWQPLIESGCRTGQELVRAWENLQNEGKRMCEFLGIDLEAPLSVPVSAIGEGSTNGSTWNKINEQRETLKG